MILIYFDKILLHNLLDALDISTKNEETKKGNFGFKNRIASLTLLVATIIDKDILRAL